MSDINVFQGNAGFERELQEGAERLVQLLAVGNLAEAMQQINHLNEMRHQTLYNEVGRLTRAVHNTIVSFTEDVSVNGLLQGSDNHIASISDASDRLAYVIELTEKNAHKTIDGVEQSLALVAQLEAGFSNRAKMLAEFDSLQQGRPEFEAFYQTACRYADDHSRILVSIKESLSEILLAQEYQDITGQLIKRVIKLVSDVEHQLVDLTAVASRVNRLNGIHVEAEKAPPAVEDKIKAEGPQMAGRGQPNIATNQDEVDDLLSSLGF